MLRKNSPFTEDEFESLLDSAVRNTGLNRDQAAKLFDSIAARPSKRNPRLECQWVMSFALACKDLDTGSEDPKGLVESTFWIRLYGIITELRGKHQKVAELYQDVVDAGGPKHDHLQAILGLFTACTQLRDALSDDELVFAAFARHVHAHVYQDGFEYDIERGNPAQNQSPRLRTKQMVRTTRRHIDVDEVHVIVDRVSGKYDHDPHKIAVGFAHVVAPATIALVQAMNALQTEREKEKDALLLKAAQPEGV